MTQPEPAHDSATYLPPATHTRSGDGAPYCPHAKPVAPGSCEFCWELHEAACPPCWERRLARLTQPEPYRVLVTGSRDWNDCQTIGDALEHAFAAAGHLLLVVHGACPTGADGYARWMRSLGLPVDIEPHPAKGHPTHDFGPWPGAGPRRNAHMVSLGADLCLAFLSPCTSSRCRRTDFHYSHGASGCARLAAEAGITVKPIYASPKDPT